MEEAPVKNPVSSTTQAVGLSDTNNDYKILG